MELDELFEGDKPEATETTAATPTPEAAPAPAVDPGEQAAPPAATEQDKMVPLSALDAERKGRKDWKEKALRVEGENALLKHQLDELRKAPVPPVAQETQRGDDFPDPIIDPEGYRKAVRAEATQIARAERLNEDEEAMVEKHGKDAVEAAFVALQAKGQAAFMEVAKGRKPWTALMKWAEGQKVRDEIGDDPAAYRQRLEEEIRKKILAEQGQPPANPQPPAPRIPSSLASTPSVAGRTAIPFTGPDPLDDIFDGRRH